MDYFWKIQSLNVQLLILYYLGNSILYEQILDEYSNDQIVDVQRIESLSDFYCVGSGNAVFDGIDPIAGEYYLKDFVGETYGTLLKCVAMQEMSYKQVTSLHRLENMLQHENEKIKHVAGNTLLAIEKQKTKMEGN